MSETRKGPNQKRNLTEAINNMIPTSDLRKGNLVKTEYGILPVHHIVFNDIYVQGKDGRVLYAREVEGVELSEEMLTKLGFILYRHAMQFDNFRLRYDATVKAFYVFYGSSTLGCVKFAHELQNLFYWIERKELIFKH